MEIVNFTFIFSTGALLVGLIILLLGWAGVRVYAIHPESPRLAITRACGVALVTASFYSLVIFSPFFGWLGERSPTLAFIWFLVANPLWTFCVTLYLNREYRVAMNNLH